MADSLPSLEEQETWHWGARHPDSHRFAAVWAANLLTAEPSLELIKQVPLQESQQHRHHEKEQLADRGGDDPIL